MTTLVALAALGGPLAIAPASAADASDNQAGDQPAGQARSGSVTARPESAANTLRAQFAPGGIKTEADAQRALDAARAAGAAADRTYRAAEIRCAGVFFVNTCRDKVRREHQEAQQEVHRVEVEAHDLQRRSDADARARTREQRAQEDAKVQSRHVDPHADPTQVQRDANKAKAQTENRAQDESAAAHRAAVLKQRQEDARKADQKRAAEAAADRAQREANVKALAQKQQDAALYAKRKEADRIENEKRRAKRRAEREANNARSPEAQPTGSKASDLPPPAPQK